MEREGWGDVSHGLDGHVEADFKYSSVNHGRRRKEVYV